MFGIFEHLLRILVGDKCRIDTQALHPENGSLRLGREVDFPLRLVRLAVQHALIGAAAQLRQVMPGVDTRSGRIPKA